MNLVSYTQNLIQNKLFEMKKILAFALGIMLMVGVASCTCSRQSEPVEVETVEVQEDTVAVDSLVIGAVAGEEEVAL